MPTPGSSDKVYITADTLSRVSGYPYADRSAYEQEDGSGHYLTEDGDTLILE